MDLQHITAKVYTRDAAIPVFTAFIPIFHGWIQRNAVADVTCIDVVDYTHVPQGPGVILVAHEGHFSMEEGDGPGLRYSNKRGASGTVGDRFGAAFGRLVRAAAMIEQETSLKGAVQFDPGHVRFVVDDRLEAPNSEDTYHGIAGHVQGVMDDLYGTGVSLHHLPTEKVGLTIDVKVDGPPSVAALAARFR